MPYRCSNEPGDYSENRPRMRRIGRIPADQICEICAICGLIFIVRRPDERLLGLLLALCSYHAHGILVGRQGVLADELWIACDDPGLVGG
jgi:hypothetical protein